MTRNGALQNKDVLISGASAAGPTLAYWLHHHGFSPTVVERAPGLRAGGYAIDLRGAAIEVAERMGVMEDARNNSTHVRTTLFVDSANQTLATMQPNFGRGEGCNGDVELLQDHLATIFYRATEGKVEYLFGDSIASIDEHEDRVDVTFENGPSRSFDLVIGADVAHSNVRRLVFGGEEQFTRYLDRCAVIFSIPNYLNLDATWLWHFRPGIIAAIMNYGPFTRCLFMFASPRVKFDSRNIEQQKRIVADAFANEKGWEFPRLIEEMWKAPDFHFDEVGQIRMDLWFRRISLIGDADSAPTLITGQGTSTAVVSAYVLAGELAAAGGDHRVAFERHEQECRSFLEQNQRLVGDNKEMTIPLSDEGIDAQIELIRNLESASEGEPLEDSMSDLIGKAANAISLKEYSRGPLN